MYCHQSNRLELLAAQLLHIHKQEPLADPLQPEIIIVQHQGLGQWLSRHWALATGIAAHLHFPSPGRFFAELYQRLSGHRLDESQYQKEVLRWRIALLLTDLSADPAAAEIRSYLRRDITGCKAHQLAARISEVFDDYLIYRPEMLLRWETDASEQHWQALLWRLLTHAHPARRARLPQLFRGLLARGGAAALPSRLHLFGLHSLAPLYLDLLAQLGEQIAVHLYQLSPCRQYWIDLAPSRKKSQAQEQDALLAFSSFWQAEDEETPANSLLASLGGAAQAFSRQLLEREEALRLEFIDLYQPHPAPKSLLAQVQNQVLDLETGGVEARLPLEADDRSIQFHCCFSPLREIQLLHDRLLDGFQEIPDLRPEDILVTAPNIDDYAAAIATVFGASQPRIPWTLADQPLLAQRPLPRVFLLLLDLVQSRFTGPELLALCEDPAVQARFGIEAAQLPHIEHWIAETGIRWGLDPEHRKGLGFEAELKHSWRFGLDRLLLGYLMGADQPPFQGMLPLAVISGESAALLGALATLAELLGQWRRRLQPPHPASAWPGLLLALVDDFFAPAAGDEGLFLLRQSIQTLEGEWAQAGFNQSLSLPLLRLHLEERFAAPGEGQSFLSGKVTLCNMAPMRSVPFRLIWLLGMQEGAFPRMHHPEPFDLIARHPRLGDRNRRADDRYLFLESLLAARDRFVVSWVGRSLRDESMVMPSPVVSEVQEYMDARFCTQDGGAVSQALSTPHPMQPFSPSCFDGQTPAMASYNSSWLPATSQRQSQPFALKPLPPHAAAERCLSLAELIRFWRHPVRFFLEQGLRMGVERQTPQLQEHEPFGLQPLEHFLLRQEAIKRGMEAQASAQRQACLAASALLPHGLVGQVALQGIEAEAQDFLAQLHPYQQYALHRFPASCTIAGFELRGDVDWLAPQGRISWRAGRSKAEVLLDLWIRHLFFQLAAPDRYPGYSLHLSWNGKEKKAQWLVLQPLDKDAQKHLLSFLEGYWQGQSRPLPFFAETSFAYAQALRQAKASPDAAMRKARAVWRGDYHRAGDCEDASHALVFGHAEPLDEEFISWSQLFLPMLAQMDGAHAAA